MKIGDLLKTRRKELDITMSEVAKACGVSEGTVSRWESGQIGDMGRSKIYALSKILLIPPTTLICPDEKEWDESIQNVEFIPDTAQVPIKVYGSVPAGVPVDAIESVEGTVYIPKAWLSGGREYIGLKVKGSSMYPKYLEDDTIIIQLQKDCRSGQDAVVYVNGYEATLKTVIKEQSGKITLRPINPEYQPHTYGPGDDPIEILGVVKQLIRNI